MIYTFKDVCEHVAEFVHSGLSPTSQSVKKRVNVCHANLMNGLDSKYKRAFMSFFTENSIVVCPSNVERIIKHSMYDLPRAVYSQAFHFHEYAHGSRDRLVNGRTGDLLDLGSRSATYYDPHVGMKMMAFSDSESDLNLSIEVQGAGNDNFLPEVIGFENAGSFRESIQIQPKTALEQMLWDPAKAGTMEFTRIDRVIKPVTSGNVVLVGWIDQGDDLPYVFVLGKYGRTERVPSYHRYKVTGEADGYMLEVYALVQLGHYEMVEDNDIPVIQNLSAFEYMCRSIDAKDLDIGRSIHMENRSYKLVRDQLKNTYVESTEFSVDVDVATGPRGLD